MIYQLEDFSGGISDTPFKAPDNCGESLDNFFIRKDKSIETVPGIEILNPVAYRLPTSTRISKLERLSPTVIVAFSDKKAYKVASTITEITGPTGNPAFNLGSSTSIPSVALFNNQLICTNDAYSYPSKIYIDDAGVTRLISAGLPTLTSAPTITPSASGTSTYIYAFVYSYEYRVGQTLFKDVSSPRYVTKTAHNAIGAAAVTTIASIPTLSNGSDYNHDVTIVKVEIYRTANNGSTFYKVKEVTNGTVSTTDNTPDSSLSSLASLYVNGGIQPNDTPPASKYVFEANDTYYWLDIIQATEKKPYRGIQSVTNDPDSVPEGNFFDTKSALKGGSSIGRSPILFTEDETLRIDGIIDELGRGNITKEKLSSTIGCIANNSIVKTSRGIYFAGPSGFYFTDGFSPPTKLAKTKIDELYKTITATQVQKDRISGCYDKVNNRIYWTVSLRENDCDTILVYEEAHDAFTTISNNGGILPTALIMDGEDLIIGDANGYLFRMSSDFYTHPNVTIGTNPATWYERPIIYSWKSTQLGFGNPAVNKWVFKINTQGNPQTNVNLAIRSYTNGEADYKELYPLRIVIGLTWGDSSFTWGDDAFVWNRVSTMNQTRRFAKGRLRARHRQIEFTNAYFKILGSTDSTASYVTVNGVSNTATLVTPSSYSFGANNEGHNMVINGVNYVILSGTADTLTLNDPGDTLVSGTYPWTIEGYAKGQRAHIMNFSIEYDTMTDMGTTFKGAALEA